VLAFQVPANFDAPSHRLVEELRASPRFSAALAGTRPASAEPLLHYARAAWDAGLVDVDAWETTYVQVLPGEDAVLEWLLGTTLRPIVSALGDAGAAAFLAELRPLLRAAYPAGVHGTPFPFTRRFLVARRPG
jgi:trans-aconitate 2-methyltransferase